jgi:hypothetical protein
MFHSLTDEALRAAHDAARLLYDNHSRLGLDQMMTGHAARGHHRGNGKPGKSDRRGRKARKMNPASMTPEQVIAEWVKSAVRPKNAAAKLALELATQAPGTLVASTAIWRRNYGQTCHRQPGHTVLAIGSGPIQ